MDCRHIKHALLPILLLASPIAFTAEPTRDDAVLKRGKYIVQTSGCHDCHTPGYPETAGQVPVNNWLTGSNVGFQGPWGTSYPTNLRLYVQSLSESEWLARVRQPMRPPMPWFSLRDMTDQDVVAIYRFLKSLGPAGEAVPSAAAPGVQVTTPFFEFVPKNLPAQAAAHP